MRSSVIGLLMLVLGTPALAAPATAPVSPVTAGVANGIVQVFHIHDATLDGYYLYCVVLDDGTRDCFRKGPADRQFVTGDRVRAAWTPGPKGGRIWTITPLVQRTGETVAQVSGMQRGLVILANYRDKNNLITSAAGCCGSAIPDFFAASSYGMLTLPLDVVGPYTIDVDAESGCDFWGHGDKLDAKARAAGVNLALYMSKTYALPSSSKCGWAGLGTVGGNPAQSWINGLFNQSVAAHELGHNKGLYHSHAIECGSTALATTGCSTLEYGDTTDTMGGGNLKDFNPAQKRRLGWLTGQDASAPGIYTLRPLERFPDALRLTRPGTTDTFWLALRSVVSGGDLKPGVTMYWDKGPDAIYLLDMTPLTSSWSDPALCVGCAWTDPLSKVTVGVLDTSPTSARVQVGGVIVPPPPPPPPPPPGGADVTQPCADPASVSKCSVVVQTVRCERTTGGSAFVRAFSAATGKLLKEVSVPNAVTPKGKTYTLRCQIVPTASARSAIISVNGVVKLAVPLAP